MDNRCSTVVVESISVHLIQILRVNLSHSRVDFEVVSFASRHSRALVQTNMSVDSTVALNIIAEGDKTQR